MKYSEKDVETFISRSEAETIHFARDLARTFKGDEVLLLEGELGAGKTVFAKGVALGLKFSDITQVCSPSYTLVNIYVGRVPIYHIDLYRLENSDEISDLGWEDFLGEGVVIVEWAEKLPFRPNHALRVKIAVGEEDIRTIEVKKLS